MWCAGKIVWKCPPFNLWDWFKLTNEVLNVRENIILCEMSLCCHPISEKKDAHDMRLVL